jgi:hypothetical protein
MGEENQRITSGTKYLMMGVALFFDVLSLVPGLNVITAFLGYGTIWFWFLTKNVVFTKNPKMVKSVLGGLAIEMLPFFSWLPAITRSVWRIATLSQIEDRKAAMKSNLKLTRGGDRGNLHSANSGLKKAA